MTGEAVSAPTQWPCVAFYESDNYTSREDLDSSDEERVVMLMYRIDVYSNKVSGRKSEAKAILADIQPLLYKRNFTRFSHTPMNDMGDKIMHMVETYRVKFDGEAFYRV